MQVDVIENYDVVDKWYRRTEDLDDLCFLQCVKMFRPGWKLSKECSGEEMANNDTEDEDVDTDANLAAQRCLGLYALYQLYNGIRHNKYMPEEFQDAFQCPLKHNILA